MCREGHKVVVMVWSLVKFRYHRLLCHWCQVAPINYTFYFPFLCFLSLSLYLSHSLSFFLSVYLSICFFLLLFCFVLFFSFFLIFDLLFHFRWFPVGIWSFVCINDSFAFYPCLFCVCIICFCFVFKIKVYPLIILSLLLLLLVLLS